MESNRILFAVLSPGETKWVYRLPFDEGKVVIENVKDYTRMGFYLDRVQLRELMDVLRDVDDRWDELMFEQAKEIQKMREWRDDG